MRKHSFAQLFLSALIAIGLILSPVAAVAGPDMQDGSQTMAGDMTCCPDKQARHDCQKCPLMIVCFAKCMPGISAGMPGAALTFETSKVIRPGSDACCAGLGFSAPARPPRTLVIPA